jgi:hypothetical protein
MKLCNILLSSSLWICWVTWCFLQAKKYGSLQVVCQYYQLQCPVRGSSLNFHPLEHLHSLKFHRPGETALHLAGSTIDLRSRDTSLEVAEVIYGMHCHIMHLALTYFGVTFTSVIFSIINIRTIICTWHIYSYFRCVMHSSLKRNRLLYPHGLLQQYVDASGWNM